jgi:hypothetical protein
MDQDLKKKITTDFGLTAMDPNEQERMIEKIGNLLFESVVERSLEGMDEGTMNEFDETISNAGEDYQKVITFLKGKVDGFDIIVKDEMSRLKRATVGIFT